MMPGIVAFTKPLCREISAEAEKALEAVAAKHGLRVVCRGGNLSDTQFSPKVTFEVVTAGGKPADFERFARMVGLPEGSYEKTFMFRSRTYQVTSVNPNAPRFPVNAKRLPDGKGFRFPVSAVTGGADRVFANYNEETPAEFA